MAVMGCFPLTWGKFKRLWFSPDTQPREGARSEEQSLLPPPRDLSVTLSPPTTRTTLATERAVPNYGATDSIPKLAISPNLLTADHFSKLTVPPKRLTIPKSSPLLTEEPTDVSPSSIRSFGSQNNLPKKPTPEPDSQAFSALGGQFSSDIENGQVDIDDELESSTPDSLETQLWDARIEWPKGQDRYFIPASDLQRLVTISSIHSELERCPLKLSPVQLLERAQEIREKATRLFAILVCMRMGHCICKFLDEGIDDQDLPLTRYEVKKKGSGASRFKLRSRRRPDQEIKCMARWGISHITNFGRDQWWMLAPIFKEHSKVRHYVLEDNCVLPFIEDYQRSGETAAGAFGCVWGVVVHPAHQFVYKSTNPKKPIPKLAVKQLHSTNKDDFLLEVEMLKAFSNHHHQHLVKLLATYFLQGKYHLLFPFADGNLRTYWESTPTPEFSLSTLSWFLNQCKGIASGLMAIHEYRTTLARDPVDTLSIRSNSGRLGENNLLVPSKGFGMPATAAVGEDRIYGRHGDIKPENILWSNDNLPSDSQAQESPGEVNEFGILIIADFGLMDFHKQKTRSLIEPEHIKGTLTYEPPERSLRVPISRAYDIWSLGCVYLEFITWLVLGYERLGQFPSVRGHTGDYEVNVDTYFMVNNEHTEAEVCPSVAEWIKDLHEAPRCSRFIHEFLDLIEGYMLVVEPGQRIRCGPLNDRLKEMRDLAKRDEEYLLKPVPRPKRWKSEERREMGFVGKEVGSRKDQDSPPPSPTEGRALPKRRIEYNLDEVVGGLPEVLFSSHG